MKETKAIEIMMELKLFDDMSKEECMHIYNVAKPFYKSFDSDSIIIKDEQYIDFIGIVLKGNFFGEKYHYDGSIELVQIFQEGDSISLETVCTPSRKSPLQIRCPKPAEIISFQYKDLLEHKQINEKVRIKLFTNIMHMLANENVKKLYKIDVLYKRTLREKVMVFLGHMETKHKSASFRIGMDREQFAQYLGANRSALSHELSLMEQDGLISFRKDFFTVKTKKTADR